MHLKESVDKIAWEWFIQLQSDEEYSSWVLEEEEEEEVSLVEVVCVDVLSESHSLQK